MHVKVVWITILALKDKRGIVEASVPGLADLARVSVDEARDAVARLEAPDMDSRTKAFEGRRIQPIDGGWLVLNHAKYREKMNEDERREYNRVKQAEFRARHETCQTPVSNSKQMSALSAHTDAESDTDTRIPPIPSAKLTKAEEIYACYPRKVGRKAALHAIAAALKANAPERLLERTAAYATATALWPLSERNFIPHPATWFNRGSYDDDPAQWKRQSTGLRAAFA